MKSETRNPKSKTGELAIVSLGSNLGDAAANIQHALERLQELSDQPILKSSLWQATPVDCPPGSPEFVNAAAAIVPRAGETPESFLAKLQALEKEWPATKKIPNEPRLLDLDLIVFGGETRNAADFILPHPRAHERKFVLQPVSEIAPDLVLPGQKKTIAKLLSELATSELLTRLK